MKLYTLCYDTRQDLVNAIGRRLRVQALPSMPVPENGTIKGTNRPHDGMRSCCGKRAVEFYAKVTLANGLIARVQ